jgi:SAM-dependent methyltransferase
MASQASPAPAARPCPQCEGVAVRPLPRYSTAKWRVVECASCGFVFLGNPPGYKALVKEFAWEKTIVKEAERRKAASPVLIAVDQKTRWRLHLFSKGRAALYRRLFRPGPVLDVGCGNGRSVPTPFIPYGIEISKALYDEAAAHMRTRGGEAIHAAAAEGIAKFPDRFFTGVVLSSIAEHEKQPKPLFRHAARILKDDGVIYVRVPNFGSINRLVMGAKWSGFRHPDHVNYFTLASLKRMVADCDLKLKLLSPALFPLNDNINAVLTKTPQARS